MFSSVWQQVIKDMLVIAQWNVKETAEGPSYFKCLYINFDNDNDGSYCRPSITVIIQNTLRVRCIGALTMTQ